MVGLVVKFEDWAENIFKILFANIDCSRIEFLVNYWESYGDKFENYDLITSSDFKDKILKSEKCYPEFCEILIRYNNKYDRPIKYYSDFLDSDYFLSISIIDHRNIEICFKKNKLVSKVCQNILQIGLKGKKIIELDKIDLDSNLSIWRQNEKGIY